MKCPKCSFQLAPLVRFPADGGPAQNVLGCMNCGWATLMESEQFELMQQAMKEPVEATLNDKQYGLILRTLRALMTPTQQNAEIRAEIHQELAAIHVRSSHTSQPNVSGVSEGSYVAPNTPPPTLDLEQGS